jgi:hypothetical protein
MVLSVSSPGQFNATQAWLWVTDPTPARVNPPPGYTFAPRPIGLFVYSRLFRMSKREGQ